VALRVGVAAVALGEAIGLRRFKAPRVARRLEGSETLASAEALLHELASEVGDLRRAIVRLSRARFDLPRSWLSDLLEGLDPTVVETTATCLTYGGERARIAVPLRRAASQVARVHAQVDEAHAHASLHDRYFELDGVRSVEEALPGATPWLERLHHGVRADSERCQGVADTDLGCRELYWDLGRALSRRGAFTAAASVFQVCLDDFDPNDAYANHYLAYNLDQEGRGAQRVERHLEKAIEVEPDNTWWHSRWITWLVRHGRPRQARRAWERALGRLDPDGTGGDEWLRHNLHRWVITEALDHGDLAFARSVFEALPSAAAEHEAVFRSLGMRLRIIEFVDRHGHALAPDDRPLSMWWIRPENLPRTDIEAWYPGRVTDIGEGALQLVVGDPVEGRAGRPRVFGLRLDAEFTVEGDVRVLPGSFVYVTRSSSDHWKIYPIVSEPVSDESMAEARRLVRYLAAGA